MEIWRMKHKTHYEDWFAKEIRAADGRLKEISIETATAMAWDAAIKLYGKKVCECEHPIRFNAHHVYTCCDFCGLPIEVE